MNNIFKNGIGGGLLVLILLCLNLQLGSLHIPLSGVIDALSGAESTNEVWSNIILRFRLPQTMVALGAGMALGIAGLLMQTLFRNPLAGPSVLGISSGASLGVAFVVLVAGQIFGLSFTSLGAYGDLAILFASLIGALSILILILMISRKLGGTLAVLIMGVMIGYMSNSIVGVMKYYSLEEDVHTYVIWGLGSFSRQSIDKAKIFTIITVVPSLLTLLLAKSLNLLSLGENYAKNLGLRTERVRLYIILSAGILTAIVTSFCGPIIFIGMAVPHLSKLITKSSNHIKLLINAGILGAATALLCNLVSRLPGLESSLPVNSVTAFIGAPVVISVLWKRRKQKLSE